MTRRSCKPEKGGDEDEAGAVDGGILPSRTGDLFRVRMSIRPHGRPKSFSDLLRYAERRPDSPAFSFVVPTT